MAEIRLTPLPFDEAIEQFKDRVVLTPKQFRDLEYEYRDLAFTVSGVGSLSVLNDLYAELEKAISEGLTVQEFSKNANAIFERKGWEGLTPFRIDTIFRTNIQTAYMVGHYRRMTDPDVVEKRPYWQYDAVNDGRTRPTHKALDGLVFRHDHPFWDTWYPPNGYRCRCGVISMSERSMTREGKTVETEAPVYVEPPGMPAIPLVPDYGFSGNPAKTKWEPDVTKCPKPLQKAYAKKMKDRG